MEVYECLIIILMHEMESRIRSYTNMCNSVSTFQRVVGKVHRPQIPNEARLFIDDAGIKGPEISVQ
jgi:hypothetical protein